MDKRNDGARLGLRLNAGFSLASGLLLALAPGLVGDWLGVSIDIWLRLLGLGLIVHFAILAWAALQPDVGQLTKLNLAAIAPYPFLMVGLVAFGLIDRSLGQGLVLIDGAIVGALALVQYLGLREPRTAVPQRA